MNRIIFSISLLPVYLWSSSDYSLLYLGVSMSVNGESHPPFLFIHIASAAAWPGFVFLKTYLYRDPTNQCASSASITALLFCKFNKSAIFNNKSDLWPASSGFDLIWSAYYLCMQCVTVLLYTHINRLMIEGTTNVQRPLLTKFSCSNCSHQNIFVFYQTIFLEFLFIIVFYFIVINHITSNHWVHEMLVNHFYLILFTYFLMETLVSPVHFPLTLQLNIITITVSCF